jgi:hypothetical protein
MMDYETIERAAEHGDVWETILSAAIDAAEQGDASRWLIGDLAILVEKSYGEDRIGEFAKGIGTAVKTVKQYRLVCRFWNREKSPREDFLAELKTVKWTHYREAMRLKELGKAIEFIEECAINAWTCEAASVELDTRLGKPPPVRKLLDKETALGIDRSMLKLSVTYEELQRLIEYGVLKGKRVRVVIYESRGE